MDIKCTSKSVTIFLNMKNFKFLFIIIVHLKAGKGTYRGQGTCGG